MDSNGVLSLDAYYKVYIYLIYFYSKIKRKLLFNLNRLKWIIIEMTT